ncbi:helix-turn-helix transcriptional regulator [Albidovulum sediminis]|uniref:DNA-binding protein n=1 Tax=Albidovulum sediminis TaxID=3066345 RepID=A0ABT2NKA1_9RHOB|nr:helix-turn-helix domain-containing protein [Defluviimonas sediminis]MCT8329358.1 DNA-binding protein [Defluviimonas sediminis]
MARKTQNGEQDLLPPAFMLMRERAVAERWNKSIRTLQRWRAEGYGPAHIYIGGTIHYRLEDILAFEERMRRGGVVEQ